MTSLVKEPVINGVQKQGESVILDLSVPGDLHYFQGHFPQAPILPGVVQVHWVLDFIEKYFGLPTASYKSIDALKFQVIISPDYQITLELKPIQDKKISFSYSSQHGQHASGKVVYN